MKKNKKNSNKRPGDSINITTLESLDLSNVQNLSVIYEQVSQEAVLTQDISGTEKILSEIAKNKCYQLRFVPFILFGTNKNKSLLEKYIVKVVIKHPEYLYYLRPTVYSKYGIAGKAPELFAVVDSTFAFSTYCHRWNTSKDELPHPDSIISQLREYLMKIGNTEEETDFMVKLCI